ncbi:BZ3501_MvSof-1269-A2-R1_C30g00069 [Microbotryum saponariae]|nr:BZ3501_MvSof-1269-A2-R1_C30g00069 [Microbotryum saponariae]
MLEWREAFAFARIRQLRNLDVTDAIIGARLNQSHQANKHRRPDDPAFRTGSYVYLSTKNLAVPDGMKSKLLPRYIGPFRIRAAIPATSSYDLELPPAMSRVHNRFHARLLRPCVENDAERFPGRDPAVLFVEDVADAADNSAIPERIVRDRRNARGARSFLVRWVGRNDTDDTWMSEQSIRLDHPSVLDAYLARLDRSNRRLAARLDNDDDSDATATAATASRESTPHEPTPPLSPETLAKSLREGEEWDRIRANWVEQARLERDQSIERRLNAETPLVRHNFATWDEDGEIRSINIRGTAAKFKKQVMKRSQTAADLEPGADLGARSEPGAPAQDLGARSEPGT